MGDGSDTKGVGDNGEETCAACGCSFTPQWAYQVFSWRSARTTTCSQSCRATFLQTMRSRESQAAASPRARQTGGAEGRRRQYRLAVLNQKGGTGKTTTAVSLASALAESGERVLLVDCDAQGHVAVSLGVKPERGLGDVLLRDVPPHECVVRARENLDILGGSDLLAGAEIRLARTNGPRDRVLRTRLQPLTDWDWVLLDCSPSQSLINTNALTYADGMIVPMACDYLSLVGVQQVLRTVRTVNEELAHPVEILGILPTFYDQRNRISDESIRAVRAHFGDRVLPAIGISTRFKEAPAEGKTIFEHAPGSRGATDYQRLARWLVERKGQGRKEAAPGV